MKKSGESKLDDLMICDNQTSAVTTTATTVVKTTTTTEQIREKVKPFHQKMSSVNFVPNLLNLKA